MRKLIYSIVFFFLVMFGYAEGENTEKDTTKIKNYRLDEIRIKSPKYNHNIFDIPAAATMLPARLVENDRIQNLADVSSVIPNFFMPDYGSKITSPIFIRGVGNRINAPAVGLYVDGIPYFDKASFNFDFYDVEQIEVLRGPQGTLYGRNAMGGLINVITRHPGRVRKTEATIDYGNYQQVNALISHNQPVSKSFEILGDLNYHNDGGFYTNHYNDSDVDALENYSGRLKLSFHPSERFNANAVVQYEDCDQVGYPYALYDDDANETSEINYNRKSTYDRKLLSSGLNLQYNADKFLVRSATSFQSINDDQDIDQDFTSEDLYFVAQAQDLKIFAQEINIQSFENKTYDWLFGVFCFTQHLDKDVYLEMGDDKLSSLPYSQYSYTKTYDNKNSGIAFFHQSILKFGDLSITAGIRADYEKATLGYNYDRSVNSNESNVANFDSDLDYFEILPKIAVKYSLSEYFVPYATIAKGYNAGGFNSTFEDEKDKTFDPERSWNYEAGIKAKWLQQRIYANLAFFYIDWENQQVYQTVLSGTGSMLTNAGKSESKGFEFEIKALPAQNLETWINFGYTDAKFKDYVKNETTDYSGNYIPYIPRFSLNIGGNYSIDIQKEWLQKIRFHLSYNGFGKHYWKEANIAYQKYYGLLNGRISFEQKNVCLSVWAKNLLDADYNSFYFQALNNSYAQVGKPSQLGISMKVNF